MASTPRTLLVLAAPLLLAAPASCAPQPLLEMAPGAGVDTWTQLVQEGAAAPACSPVGTLVSRLPPARGMIN